MYSMEQGKSANLIPLNKEIMPDKVIIIMWLRTDFREFRYNRVRKGIINGRNIADQLARKETNFIFENCFSIGNKKRQKNVEMLKWHLFLIRPDLLHCLSRLICKTSRFKLWKWQKNRIISQPFSSFQSWSN